MIQAGNISAMQRAGEVQFSHAGKVFKGVVQWIEDNESVLSHERNHPGCVSVMLSDGSTMNDLPKSTPVAVL